MGFGGNTQGSHCHISRPIAISPQCYLALLLSRPISISPHCYLTTLLSQKSYHLGICNTANPMKNIEDNTFLNNQQQTFIPFVSLVLFVAIITRFLLSLRLRTKQWLLLFYLYNLLNFLSTINLTFLSIIIVII